MRTLGASLLALGAVAVPAHAEWRRARSAHFQVYGNVSEQRLRELSDRLERFDAMLRTLIVVEGAPGEQRPVTVFLVPTLGDLHRMTGVAEAAGFYRSGWNGDFAYVVSKIGGNADEPDALSVLQHEYAHHFMLANLPNGYPAWYVEGFAEFYATARPAPKGGMDIGLPPLFRGRALIAGGYPVKSMVTRDPGRLDVDGAAFYGTAWLLTHYLMFTPGRPDQLRAYLDAYASGQSLSEAARAFGDLDALAADVAGHFRQPKLSYVRREGLPSGPAPVIQLLDPVAADMIGATMEAADGIRRQDAPRMIAQGKTFTARYPGYAPAWSVLAEAQLAGRDLDAATRANERLLTLDPGDVEGLTRRARILETRLIAEGAGDARWAEVRRLAAIANRADPSAPGPLFTFFIAYVAQGMAPSDNASEGLRTAYDNAPQIALLRLVRGADLVRLGDMPRARRVLAPLINHPHSAWLREASAKILATAPGSPTLLPQLIAVMGRDQDHVW